MTELLAQFALLQLTDYRGNPDLKLALKLKDLVNVVHTYLYSETLFENDLHLYCADRGPQGESIVDALLSTSHPGVLHWLDQVLRFRQGMDLHPESERHFASYLLEIFFSIDAVCNRVWCFYRPDSRGACGKDCICSDPLTLNRLLTSSHNR